ncbi:MAG: DUF1802 family protein [Planctomycetes bacterium]|nr:DUF1802 family protein [Planctomycetota bacterium]
MLERNRYALKEWAILQQVLASGQETLLVRKGGIHEKRGGFTIEHREFFLYPTFVHQRKEDLLPLFHKDLDAIQAVAHDEHRLELTHYATVEDVRQVTDLGLAQSLAGHHILSTTAIDARFNYRNNPWVHVMVLRVYRLARPIALPVTESYAGCVSWVDLEQELPTEGAVPVLTDAEFAVRLDTLRKLLAPVPAI